MIRRLQVKPLFSYSTSPVRQSKLNYSAGHNALIRRWAYMTRVVKIHARISEVTSAKFILARRAHQVQRGEVLRGNPDSPVLSLVSTSSSSANISLEPRRSVGGTENNVRSPASKWLTCVSLGCPAAPPSCKARLKTQNVAQNSMDPI